MPEWRNFVNKEGSSSKFWKFCFVDGGKSVKKEWGRIGGRMDTQTKVFSSEYAAQSYVETEIGKKLRKGYTEETAENLKEQIEIAQILGTRWKINRMEFVQPGGGTNVEFGENYYASAGVFVEMLESWSKDRCWLLITKNDAKQFRNCAYSGVGANLSGANFRPDGQFVLGIRKAIRNLQEAVEQVLVKFAAVGTRILEIDGFTPSEADPQLTIEFQAVAASTGASKQAIQKFAAMGNRILEI